VESTGSLPTLSGSLWNPQGRCRLCQAVCGIHRVAADSVRQSVESTGSLPTLLGSLWNPQGRCRFCQAVCGIHRVAADSVRQSVESTGSLPILSGSLWNPQGRCIISQADDWALLGCCQKVLRLFWFNFYEHHLSIA
jgi:hypothetical protein